MPLILTRTTERARFVWSRDPEVTFEDYVQVGDDLDVLPSVLIPESEAKCNGEATYFVLRPLNAAEVFSYFHDEERATELSTRLDVACAACVGIERHGIEPIRDAAKVRETLDGLGDVALVNAIYEAAKEASLRGVGRDPFRSRSGGGES